MKKLIVLSCVFVLFAVSGNAADFSPTLLKLSAPETINYQFDSSELTIPVRVTGPSASVIFFVFTKDMAENIEAVNNGFLGWHFVNKVDTCVYVSQTYAFSQGDNQVKWNGKDTDGGSVPKGEYTYYLWAYDSVNAKTKFCKI